MWCSRWFRTTFIKFYVVSCVANDIFSVTGLGIYQEFSLNEIEAFLLICVSRLGKFVVSYLASFCACVFNAIRISYRGLYRAIE